MTITFALKIINNKTTKKPFLYAFLQIPLRMTISNENGIDRTQHLFCVRFFSLFVRFDGHS